MSYCRWSEDSDLYVYPSFWGYFICFRCPLKEEDKPFLTKSRKELLDHLAFHLVKGYKVPNRAFKKLKEEIEEFGDKWDYDDEETENIGYSE